MQTLPEGRPCEDTGGEMAVRTPRREASGGASPARPWVSASILQGGEEEVSVVAAMGLCSGGLHGNAPT